jgi:dimethylhistidine N-methyltransferase
MREGRGVIATGTAATLRANLTRAPRQVPASYFYDALGSVLFEAICLLPWYPIPRAETALLVRHARAIAAAAGWPARIVELGPGGGDKLRAWLDAVAMPAGVRVHLVDVSGAALEAARIRLAAGRGLPVETHEADYEEGLAQAVALPIHGPSLVMFLGSNIGNFDPPECDRFLRAVRASLAPGDVLLMGADLIKDPRDLELAYDDPLGVTAAFNLNVLARLNRECGASFDLTRFAHRAVWNADASRVEMHLVSLDRQSVRLPGLDLAFELDRDEWLWTESSYKFEPADLADRCRRAGFTVLEQWVNEADRFALTMARS